MPFLHLQLATAPGIEADDATLARVLTRLTGQILHKRPEVTALRIDRVSPDAWFIGALPLAPRLQATLQLRIAVTAGTNSADEKARYIAAVFEELGTLLGGLHPASYVIVDELAADAWGYGGRTQAARKAQAATEAVP